MTSLLHAALTLAMASPGTLSLHAAVQAAQEPSETHYRAHITIDTAALREGLDAKEVDKQQDLFERDVPTLFGSKVGLAQNPGTDVAEVRIIVRWEDFADFRYGVTMEATTPGGEKNEKSFDFQGDEHDLVQRLKDEVPTVVGWLKLPEQVAAPPDKPPPETNPKHPPGNTDDKPEGRGLLWTGVGLSVVGAALLPTGVVLHMRTSDQRNGFESTTTERRHPLPLTATLMGLGGAALGAGVALIVIGSTKAKKSKGRASITPNASPSQVGLSVQGRF